MVVLPDGGTSNASPTRTDQRHRYECDPCDRRGPLRNDRDQAARDAQQHDIGFHDGTVTCELVAFEVATDGGEEFPYDSWFEAVQALGRQFEAENDDLEVTLEGSIGFISLFTDEPPADVTRGVVTAMHQAVYETIEAVSLDEELLEMRYGEVTPEAAADAVLDQIDEYQYVSDPLRSNIRERVEARVHHNMDKHVEAER